MERQDCMIKKYITEEWNLKRKRHKYYDFLNVAINSDNLLFIDPCLVELLGNSWSQKAMKKIDSYMGELVRAYTSNDAARKIELLKCAQEQNATKLGYGNGVNGKGNTADGLLADFQPLEKLMSKIASINCVQDITVLLPGFAEDGLSDLLTNILHLELSEYTDMQMQKHGIKSNGEVEFMYWDDKDLQWKRKKKCGCLLKGKEFLLVPKKIVRKGYLFNTGSYFSKVILENMRDEYTDDKGNQISKNDVIKAKRYSADHWMYKEVVQYTEKDNDALNIYHNKMLGYYIQNGGAMKDEELDEAIFGE